MELDELLQSEDFKADPKKAIEGFVNGLVTKKNELLDKLQNMKTSGSETASELERLKALEQSVKVKEEEDKKNYSEALRLMKETHEAELKKSTDEANKLNSELNKLLIGDGLSNALDSVKVMPGMKKAVTAMLNPLAELKDGKAFVGDKALSDYVKEWASSDEGKHFISAENNGGGGTPPGGGANYNGVNPFAKETNNLTEQIKLKMENPELASQLKASAGA